MSFQSKQMRQRENRNNNPQPLGICQRLFNFIMNTLTAQSLRRLSNPPASQSIEVPVEGPPTIWEEPNYHPENSNPEVRVDFRHINGWEHPVAKNDNAIANGERGRIRPVEHGFVRPPRNMEIDSQGQVNGQELDSNTTGGSRGKLPTKVVGISDRGGEKKKVKLKLKHESTVAAASAGEGEGEAEAEDEDRAMTPFPVPFLDNDINGKADEFIRKKRNEFVRRSSTLDLPKSN